MLETLEPTMFHVALRDQLARVRRVSTAPRPTVRRSGMPADLLSVRTQSTFPELQLRMRSVSCHKRRQIQVIQSLGVGKSTGILSYGSRSSIRSWESAEVRGQKLNFVCALTLSATTTSYCTSTALASAAGSQCPARTQTEGSEPRKSIRKGKSAL